MQNSNFVHKSKWSCETDINSNCSKYSYYEYYSTANRCHSNITNVHKCIAPMANQNAIDFIRLLLIIYYLLTPSRNHRDC